MEKGLKVENLGAIEILLHALYLVVQLLEVGTVILFANRTDLPVVALPQGILPKYAFVLNQRRLFI